MKTDGVMTMKCVDVVRLGAALCVPLLLSACALFLPGGPGPDRFQRAERQFEILEPPLEKFRRTYLLDFASCGKEVQCVPGSRPNFVTLPESTQLELAFAFSYQACLIKNGCLLPGGGVNPDCAMKNCQSP